MSEFWDEDRRRPRGEYVIPCLLRDTETNVYLKAVILDLSATGCRVFTNDSRVRLMDEGKLRGKTLHVEFDFYDVETGGIDGQVVNVHPGKDPRHERQLGIRFTTIDPITRRDINRLVNRDVEQRKEKIPGRVRTKDWDQ
jgi:c-di-GMP-binding flagellar brake protein YcgR